MDLKKQEINGKSSQKEDARGVPRRWDGSPGLRGTACILFLTTFTIDFSRSEVQFSCSVLLLGRIEFSAPFGAP